jgi:ketosteroid isomerase-like protein
VRVLLRLRAVILATGASLAPLAALASWASGQTPTDSADVATVVERYHRALAAGDSLAALALLADDAVILESGGVESRQEYRSHHLADDIAFARAVKGTRSAVHVAVEGNVAWTTATSTTRGKYRGRAVNSAGAELMVLTRTPGGWKIRAIHWSSHGRRP